MTAWRKRRNGPRGSPAFRRPHHQAGQGNGSTRPAYICQGWGPQRQANGELTSRAIAMLPILTGNGGNSGARESTYTITIERMPLPETR